MKHSIPNGLLLAVISVPTILANPAPLSHKYKLYFSYSAPDPEAYKLLEWGRPAMLGLLLSGLCSSSLAGSTFRETEQDTRFMWSNNTNDRIS
jgi:hypothetical protein